jgi:hypothetical protein
LLEEVFQCIVKRKKARLLLAESSFKSLEPSFLSLELGAVVFSRQMKILRQRQPTRRPLPTRRRQSTHLELDRFSFR